MWRRGRLTRRAEATREDVEQALFDLGISLDLQDEALLRIQQAMHKTTAVHDVLNPAVVRLVQSMNRTDRARGILGLIWRTGKREKWQDD